MLNRYLLSSFILASMLTSHSGAIADPVVDDFERGTLGSNWRVIFGGASPGIVNSSDLGLINDSSRFGLVSWSATSFSADQYSEAVISSDKNPDMLAQVFVRWRESDNARYAFHYAGDPGQADVFEKWEIKYDGVPTNQVRSLASSDVSIPPGPGDTLRIEITGFTIKGFHNGVEVISVTDTDMSNRIPSGEPGMAYRWATSLIAGVYPAPVWENWFAGSLDAAPPTIATPDITVLDSSGDANDLQVIFGEVGVMQSVDRSVFVRNDGDADLMIQQIAVNDPLAAPFSVLMDNCTAVTLTPNTSCSFKLRFSPSSTGIFNDTFNIPTNDPDENPVTVSVSGIGTSENPVTDSVSDIGTSTGGGGGSGGSILWSFILLVTGMGFLRRT